MISHRLDGLDVVGAIPMGTLPKQIEYALLIISSNYLDATINLSRKMMDQNRVRAMGRQLHEKK